MIPEKLSTLEELVAGRGHYVDDIVLPEMLHMAVFRSPYARARLVSVKGGINGNELRAHLESVGEGATQGAATTIEPVLATDSVNYLGQPVAAVFGNSLYDAEDALSQVDAEFEPLKPIVTIEDALSLPPIHPSAPSNVISDRWRGKPFEEKAPIVLEDEFYNRRVGTNPIETRGVVAQFEGGKLTVWTSTQSAHSIKEGLCGALSLNAADVRVIQADTGGAFGLKGGLYSEYIVACYAAMKMKRPVKWIETRREHLMASRPGRGVRGHVKLFAERDGRVTGLKGEVIVDGGAYSGGMSEFASNFIAMQMTGPYAIRQAHVRAMSVFTNKVPLGPYRGAGRPEAAFFVERMMDMLADELKKDPVEIRLLNAAEGTFKSPLGMEFQDSKKFIEDAARELDYTKKRQYKAGFACFVLVPATQPGETCRIRVDEGRIRVWVGGNSHGQGHDIFIKKLLAEELGAKEDIIEVERGDTDMLEDGVGAWGSRSAIVVGDAVISVARKIKDQAEKEFGGYRPELLQSSHFDVYNFQKHDKSLNSLGANAAVVDIDEFGNVNVKEIAAYYDVGKALNMDMVISQIIGGSMQGIGQTLSEEIAYNEEGQLLTASIADAGLRTAETAPAFVIKLAPGASSLPHGAKGLGEAPTIGVPAALCRAIELVSGKRIRETPVRPDMLLGLK
ncbi:MAG: xanthine dehydrogenase family protein molybdopterin-binding subunit [Methanomassiliicoccales archaeon]